MILADTDRLGSLRDFGGAAAALRSLPRSFESLIFARIFDHGLHRFHGLKRNPCWLVFIRVIREIRGSSRFGGRLAALGSLAAI
jgi:hypothetical protein